MSRLWDVSFQMPSVSSSALWQQMIILWRNRGNPHAWRSHEATEVRREHAQFWKAGGGGLQLKFVSFVVFSGRYQGTYLMCLSSTLWNKCNKQKVKRVTQHFFNHCSFALVKSNNNKGSLNQMWHIHNYLFAMWERETTPRYLASLTLVS